MKTFVPQGVQWYNENICPWRQHSINMRPLWGRFLHFSKIPFCPWWHKFPQNPKPDPLGSHVYNEHHAPGGTHSHKSPFGPGGKMFYPPLPPGRINFFYKTWNGRIFHPTAYDDQVFGTIDKNKIGTISDMHVSRGGSCGYHFPVCI